MAGWRVPEGVCCASHGWSCAPPRGTGRLSVCGRSQTWPRPGVGLRVPASTDRPAPTGGLLGPGYDCRPFPGRWALPPSSSGDGERWDRPRAPGSLEGVDKPGPLGFPLDAAAVTTGAVRAPGLRVPRIRPSLTRPARGSPTRPRAFPSQGLACSARLGSGVIDESYCGVSGRLLPAPLRARPATGHLTAPTSPGLHASDVTGRS